MIPWRKDTVAPPAVFHYSSSFAAGFLPARFAAVTIGRHVLTARDELPPLAKLEEECHVEQWYRFGRFGLGFLVRYLWGLARFGYWNNPLEVEARAGAVMRAGLS